MEYAETFFLVKSALNASIYIRSQQTIQQNNLSYQFEDEMLSTTTWAHPIQYGITGTPSHSITVVDNAHNDMEHPVLLNILGDQYTLDIIAAKTVNAQLSQVLMCLECDVSDNGHSCAVSSNGTCEAIRHRARKKQSDGPPPLTWWVLLGILGLGLLVNVFLLFERLGGF